MTARINLNLLPEQHLYLEHLIKELVFSYANYEIYQTESRGADTESGKQKARERAERYWKDYRKTELLLDEEFGIKHL